MCLHLNQKKKHSDTHCPIMMIVNLVYFIFMVKTNAKESGVATITGVPVYDQNNNVIVYTVKEEAVPIRYVTPAGQTVTLSFKTSVLSYSFCFPFSLKVFGISEYTVLKVLSPV